MLYNIVHLRKQQQIVGAEIQIAPAPPGKPEIKEEIPYEKDRPLFLSSHIHL